MRTGVVNVFQRLVRQWETAHPYNAAQIMRIEGRADRPALVNAWRQTLQIAGVGSVRVLGTRRLACADNPMANDPAVPDGQTLEEYLNNQLNAPFPDCNVDWTCPFRPFVMDAPDGRSHYAGVVYQHWVADSASVRMLMQDWFLRIHDPQRARQSPLEIPANGYWHYFGPIPGRWRLTEAILGIPRWTSRWREVRKVRTQGSTDYSMSFLLRPAADGLIDTLRCHARRHDATVNDLFLAAMALACATFVPRQRARRRRHGLALGTIVDLRGGRTDMADIFGLFLGFTNVIAKPADLAAIGRLIECISRQTRRQKSDNMANTSMVWMSLSLLLRRFWRSRSTHEFYCKNMPLTGGISNINLNGSWVARYHPAPLLQYIRVSPTGPMIPLAFTPTTLGRTLHLGLTYRQAVIDATTAGNIADHFMNVLNNLE